MNTKMTLAICDLLAAALSGSALAADLRNSDGKAYKCKLVDGNNGKTSMPFDSNARLMIEGGIVKAQ